MVVVVDRVMSVMVVIVDHMINHKVGDERNGSSSGSGSSSSSSTRLAR